MSEHSFSSAWRAQPLGRRNFLRVSAASAATVALVATTGCSTETPEPVEADPHQIALPSADKGLFYYGYLLALALSTTYDKILASPPTDLTTAERTVIANMRDHQLVYRELYHYYIDPTIGGALFPTDFAFNTATFTLTTRLGVLAAVQQLADLAAAAYPVLLPLFTSASAYPRALLLKTVSVQARHAATIRDLRTPGSFADSTAVEPSTGLLRTKTPAEVNAALAPYFAPYVISVANLAVPV
ncbi:ferritin-like domain-containing protein [Hymenobacter sp. DH14]|uniref:Ferritin-like domain-containing protein n=1 Tax=Hymenobacter cyanobacteriorum TaxID=2926463 RepID=A0A9X1VQE3_9BACT|nr:ferritin-like domain-containing protein [Hymenobacter cyanobacteriorum]MCI1190196.1 ferritin-like domain-containing protein [Hymenobacter cyanobacteriorum]